VDFLIFFNLVITHVACHLGVDPVKIEQKVTFAKGPKHRGQNIHFF